MCFRFQSGVEVRRTRRDLNIFAVAVTQDLPYPSIYEPITAAAMAFYGLGFANKGNGL